ncbi:MAG: FGLLP motif-containing membrane protein, partial [Acidimicrobiia bacterium]
MRRWVVRGVVGGLGTALVLLGVTAAAGSATDLRTYPAPEAPPLVAQGDDTTVEVGTVTRATSTVTTTIPAPVVEAQAAAPATGTVVQAATPPAEPASRRPSFVAQIPRPSEISWNARHVGANASIAFGLVLLLGLPAEHLNSSLKARAARRLSRPRFVWFTRFEARLNKLPDPLLLVAFSVAGAVVYSQLEPEMRLDSTSMLFLAALSMAFVVVTGVLEVVRIPYLYRRHRVQSHLTMFPRAFLLAVVLVLVSRVTGFQPGFIFGITCGLAVTGRLNDEDEGRSIAVACGALLGVAALGWLAWIPVSAAATAAHPSNLDILFDSFLATLWVTGLQVV